MTDGEPGDGAALDELDVDECYGLLATVVVGRIAVTPPGGAPLVVPVTFALDGDSIVFRSDDGSKLLALREQPASFQADAFDPFHRVGWSVLVQGVAEEIEPDPTVPLQRWVARPLQHWIRIVPAVVTGRRLRLPPVPDRRAGYV